MLHKLVLCALLTITIAQIPPEVKKEVESKIAAMTPDAQKYANQFLNAYQESNGDFEAYFLKVKAIKEQLKSDPNVKVIKTELESVISKQEPPTAEQKQEIGRIVNELSPNAKAVAEKLNEVIMSNSDEKLEQIHDIIAGVTDPATKEELKKAREEFAKIVPQQGLSV